MLQPGQVIDRFTVERLLGRGGMAEVYLVRHNALDSLHALKVLTVSNPVIRERLMQEKRVQARLRHPNVVAVYDVLNIGGTPGLLLEYVDGPSLDRWIRQERPALDAALDLFGGILAGVDRAHRLGLVHRDLKPANVLLDQVDGRIVPRVADFGLAKILADEEGTGHTRTGATMGTPRYMAPEQIRNAKNVDQRADVFSLGCILYELCCGLPPFDSDDLLELFQAIAHGRYRPPEQLVPDLPEGVIGAIVGCLQPDRELRLPDCTAVRGVLADPSIYARYPGLQGIFEPATDRFRPVPLDPEPARPAAAPSTDRPSPTPAETFPWMDAALEEPQPEQIVRPPPPPPRQVEPEPGADSAESIDMGLDREELPAEAAAPRRRWPVVAGLVGAVAVAVGMLQPWESPSADEAPQGEPSPASAEVEAGSADVAEPAVAEPAVAEPAVAEPAVAEPAAATAPTPPKPQKAAEIAPQPQPFTARFHLAGDARTAWLRDSAGRSYYAGEEVPAGRYTVVAVFEGEAPHDAGTVDLAAGAEVTIRCGATFQSCSAS